MSCHPLLACRVLLEKSADNLMGISLYVKCSFFLVAFNILYLIFVSLTIMFLSVVFLGLIPCRILYACWIGWWLPFPCWGNFQVLTLQISSQASSLSLHLLGALSCECWCVWHCLRGVLNCPGFLSFFFFILFHNSDFQRSVWSLMCSSASFILLLIPF